MTLYRSKRLVIILGLLCLCVSASAQRRSEVKRTECVVQVEETGRMLVCFDEDTEKEFSLAISANHPWSKYLDDTQSGVSKVVIEGRGHQVCLMQVKPLGDLVRHPVNERINVCVSVKPKRKR